MLSKEEVEKTTRGYEILRALEPIVTAKPAIDGETGLPEETHFGWKTGVFYHFPNEIFDEKELYLSKPGGIVSKRQ